MALESNKPKTQLVRRVTATGPRRGTRLSPSKASKTKDVQETVLPIQDKTPRRTSPRKLSAVNDVSDKEEEEEEVLKTNLSRNPQEHHHGMNLLSLMVAKMGRQNKEEPHQREKQ